MTSSVFNTCNVLYGLCMFHFCLAHGPKTMVTSAGLHHTQTATAVQIFQQLLKMKLVISVPRAFFLFYLEHIFTLLPRNITSI